MLVYDRTHPLELGNPDTNDPMVRMVTVCSAFGLAADTELWVHAPLSILDGQVTGGRLAYAEPPPVRSGRIRRVSPVEDAEQSAAE